MTPPACRAGRLCRWLVLLGCVYGLLAQGAGAMSIRELRALERSDPEHGEDYALYYLLGTMEATLHAEAAAVRAGLPPRICLNGRRLEPDMVASLYRTELRRNADVYEADMPVALVFANALATVYVCQQ